MPDSISERIHEQEFELIRSFSGLQVLTEVINELVTDSDTCGAPKWWSEHKMKSLTGATASLSLHTDQSVEDLQSLLREREEKEGQYELRQRVLRKHRRRPCDL